MSLHGVDGGKFGQIGIDVKQLFRKSFRFNCKTTILVKFGKFQLQNSNFRYVKVSVHIQRATLDLSEKLTVFQVIWLEEIQTMQVE
jgi:hypothetical protein